MANNVQRAAGALNALTRAGGADKLPEMSGPRVEQFDRLQLAKALEQEIARAMEQGWPKVSLHMDLDDAYRLALVLKGGR